MGEAGETRAGGVIVRWPHTAFGGGPGVGCHCDTRCCRAAWSVWAAWAVGGRRGQERGNGCEGVLYGHEEHEERDRCGGRAGAWHRDPMAIKNGYGMRAGGRPCGRAGAGQAGRWVGGRESARGSLAEGRFRVDLAPKSVNTFGGRGAVVSEEKKVDYHCQD